MPAVAGCKPETGLNILLITEYARSVWALPSSRWKILCVLTGNRCMPPRKPSVATSPVLPAADDKRANEKLARCSTLSRSAHDIVPSSHDLRATNLKTNKFYITRGAKYIGGGRLQSRPRDAGKKKRLNAMGIPHQMHVTGKDARERISWREEAEAEN